MITLTKEEQATTFLSLIGTWKDKNLDVKEQVKRQAIADTLAYHLSLTHLVFGVSSMLDRARREQTTDKQPRFWRVNFEDLADLVGSHQIARLALGVSGYWPSRSPTTGSVSWCDIDGGDGARTDLVLPCKLSSYGTRKKAAA